MLQKGQLYEAFLPRKTGMTREELATYRDQHLEEGRDFIRTKSSYIWEGPAWRELANRRNSKEESSVAAPDGDPSPPCPHPCLGVVSRPQPGRNQKLVEVRTDAGETINVRVRDNSLFKAGMLIMWRQDGHSYHIDHSGPSQHGRYPTGVERRLRRVKEEQEWTHKKKAI